MLRTCSLICLFAIVASSALHARAKTRLADGCSCVFLDVGANQGLQTRKLFEPELYPNAPWTKLFAESFGDIASIRSDCCAFGFEPNPIHHPKLRALAAAYNKKGWRTTFIETAAWTEDGNMTFWHEFEKGKDDGNELSSRLMTDSPASEKSALVKTGRLEFAAEFES